MSRTVEQRVVEMRFDNSQFERGVSQSQASLNAFNQSLGELGGSRNGIAAFASTLKGITFDPINNGIHIGIGKLSALTAALTGVSNIADSLYSKVTGTVRALSGIDNVTRGFEKYTSATEAMQTIISATRKDGEDMAEAMSRANGALEEVLWFSDETSYSAQQMTDAIGKFASAGVDLNDAKDAIEGIALWAATAGVNAQKASGAFYNISQSMGSGYMTGMDFKSLEMLNFTTEKSRKEILDTAVAMGKLRQEGSKYFTEAGTEVTAGNIRETLSEKWFDVELMTTVFKKYSAIVPEIKRMIDEGIVETASEAIEVLKDQGVEAAEMFSLNAFEMGQEAKTLSEALESVSDAASSKFQQMFQAILGNYIEAKELFTDLAEGLYIVFVEPLDKMLKAFKEWKKANREITFKALYTIIQNIYAVFSKFKETWEAVFGDKQAKTERILNNITNIILKLSGAIRRFSSGLLNNQKIWDNITTFATGLHDIMSALKQIFKDFFEQILSRIGRTGSSKFIEFLSGIFAWIGKLLSKLAELINNTNVVSKVFEGFEKVSKNLKGTFEVLGKVFKRIFHFEKDRNIIWQLGTAAIEFKSPLENICDILRIVIDLAGSLVLQLTPMISAIWALIKSIINFISKLLENFAPVIENAIGMLTKGITAATETMTEYFNSAEFTNPFEVIGGVIRKIGEGIGKFISYIIDGIVKVKNAAADSERRTFLDRIGEGIANFAETLYAHREAVEWMQKYVFGNKDMVTVMLDVANGIVKIISTIAVGAIKIFGTIKIIEWIMAVLTNGKGGIFSKITAVMSGLQTMWANLQGVANKFANAKLVKSIAFFVLSIAGSLFLLSSIPAVRIVGGVIAICFALIALGVAVKMLMSMLEKYDSALTSDTTNAFEISSGKFNIKKGFKGKRNNGGLYGLVALVFSIGAACLMMASAVSIIASVTQWDSALVGFAGLALLIAAITGVIYAISKMKFSQEDVSIIGIIAVMFLSIGKALQWIGKGIASMASVGDQEAIAQATGCMMIMLTGILAIVLFASVLNAEESSLRGMAVLMASVALMFIGIGIAAKIISKVPDIVEMFPALLIMTIIVETVIILVALIAKAVENINSGAQVGALALISVIITSMVGAIMAIAAAIILMCLLVPDADKIWTATGAIAAIVVIMGLIATLASTSIGGKGGSIEQMLGFAAGFALMGAAILAFVPALWALSKIDFGKLMAGVLVIGILIGLFVGISALVGNFLVIAKGMQVFTTALVGLSIAMAIGSVSFLIVAWALSIIVSAFEKLVAIGPAAAEQIKSIAKALGEGIVEIFKGVANGFIELFKIFVENKTTIAKYAGTMIGTFIQALMGNLPALLDYIKQVMQGILDLLWTFGPGILEFITDQTEQLLDSILDTVINLGPKLNKAVTLLVKTALLEILGMLKEVIPAIVETVFVALMDSITRITKSIAEFEDVLFDALNTLADALLIDLPIITGKFTAIGVTMIVGWITGMITGLMRSIPTFIDEASKAFVNMVDELSKVLAENVGPVYNALKQLIQSALIAFGEWCGRFYADTNGNGYKIIKKICAYVTEGFYKGFTDQKAKNRVAEGIKLGITDVATDTAMGQLEVHSPSKLFERIGSYVTDGFSIGVDSGLPGVKDSAKSMASTFTSSLSGAFGKTGDKFKAFGEKLTERFKSRMGENGGLFSGLFNTKSMSSSLNGMFDGMMNLNPTITPSLDLSQVKSGATELDGLFSNNQVMAISDINDWSGAQTALSDKLNMENSLETKSQMNDFMGMFEKYLDIQQYNAEQPTNVNVTLEGDASKMLKLLKIEDLKQSKASGTMFFNRGADSKGNVILGNVFNRIHN